jgi:tRNA threonylcarbamoyladenosine biosynthesis protein TsaE
VLSPGLAIYLHGDLGAGKTALTRALLHAAGHQGRVKSPPTPVRTLQVQLAGRMVTVIHFDLYRMASPEEFLDAGFREHFNENSVCIVEWPEKGAPVLPPPDMNVNLSLAGHGRDVELRALSDKGHQCLARLKFAQPVKSKSRRTILKAGGALLSPSSPPARHGLANPGRARLAGRRLHPRHAGKRQRPQGHPLHRQEPGRLVVDIEGLELNPP